MWGERKRENRIDFFWVHRRGEEGDWFPVRSDESTAALLRILVYPARPARIIKFSMKHKENS